MSKEQTAMELIKHQPKFAGVYDLDLYLLRKGQTEVGYLIVILDPEMRGVYMTRFGQRLLQINDLYQHLLANEERIYNSTSFGSIVEEFYKKQ